MKASKTILLVEDDKSDQFFFLEAIKKIEGVSLYYIANNGVEALYKLGHSDELPDIIFTDINMPQMDGIEYLTELKKNPHVKNIPVVILSSETGRIPYIRSLGASAFIKKSSNYRNLQPQIEHVLNMDFARDTEAANQTFEMALLQIN